MPITSILSDGTYSAAKSYALRGTLLPKASLENLAEAKGLEDLVTRMKATAYDEAVSRIKEPHTAYKVELAAKEHLAKIHFNLMKSAPNREILLSYYMRYITSNLKTVLKGKALGRPFETISRYIDLFAEELIGRRDMVTRLLASEGLEEALNLLGDDEYSQEIRGAVSSYKERGRLEVFDLFLDKAFYTGLAKSFVNHTRRGLISYSRKGASIRPLVAVDIDSYNALSVLRGKSWGLTMSQVRSLIVELTFEIPASLLNLMAVVDNVGEALKLLERTPYRRILSSIGSQAEASISSLEDSFRMLGYQRADRPFLWEAFSDGLPVALIKLKELEVKNIASIAFGVEQRMPSTEIIPKLQLPKR